MPLFLTLIFTTICNFITKYSSSESTKLSLWMIYSGINNDYDKDINNSGNYNEDDIKSNTNAI